MIETPNFKLLPHFDKPNPDYHPPMTPLKASESHGSLVSNRFQSPVKLRKLIYNREFHTEANQDSLMEKSWGSKSPILRSSELKRPAPRSLFPKIQGNMFKDNIKEIFSANDNQEIRLIKPLSMERQEEAKSPTKRPTKFNLKPVETRRRKDSHNSQLEASGSSFSPGSGERHIQPEGSINRDISDVLEPIAHESCQKFRKINLICSKRGTSLNHSPVPKTQFEEEILEAMNKRFVQDKLDNELKVIKPMQSEGFRVSAEKKAYFKLFARNLKFPIKGRVVTRSLDHQFEVFVSTKFAKPNNETCDHRFITRDFLIDSDEKVEWVYFTLSAIVELDVKIWIFPDAGRKLSEEDLPIEPLHVVKASQHHLSQPVPDNLKNKYMRLYPFVVYTPEQMEEFKEEIKELKIAREAKTKKLAKDGRNIVTSNIEVVKNLNRDYFTEKIFIHTEKERGSEVGAAENDNY